MSEKKIRINKKVIIIGAVIEVALIAAILFSIFYEDPSYKNYLSKGREQLSDKQYEKAIASFDKALEIEPEGVEAFIGQSDAYMGLKEYDQAIAKIESAKNISVNDPAIYDKLVTACVQSGDINLANEVVTEIIQTGIPTDEITSVPSAPKITPNSGSSKKAVKVKIEGDDAPVYYTTNGKMPTADANKYKKAIELNIQGKYRIIARTIQDNGLMGFPTTKDYAINLEKNVKSAKYSGTWSDGETTLSISDINGDEVKFNIKLSWVDEVIKTSSSGKVKDGVLYFSYTDNWDNKGNGTLMFADDSITLNIKETKSSGTTTPGFGTYSAVLRK